MRNLILRFHLATLPAAELALAMLERSARWIAGNQLELFGVSGTCLRPWLVAGDALWIDPLLSPQDGDLAAVRLTYRTRSPATFFCPAGWRVRKAISLKQFRCIGGRTLLVCNEGAVELPDDAEIVGVATAFHRPRFWKLPMHLMTFDASREVTVE